MSLYVAVGTPLAVVAFVIMWRWVTKEMEVESEEWWELSLCLFVSLLVGFLAFCFWPIVLFFSVGVLLSSWVVKKRVR